MGEKKVKDYQPPYEEPRENFSSEDLAEGLDRPEREEIKDISNEASHGDHDAALRQARRGDETKGDPDERDIAGATPSKDTPHGREETKQDKAGAANRNG